MQTFTYADIEALNGILDQLPPGARTPESGLSVRPIGSGRYELTVPDEFAGDVVAADPDRREIIRRPVPKSLVLKRVKAAGKIGDAFTALLQAPELFGRWFTPDHPYVNSDDADTIAFLSALGLNAIDILAP